MPRRLPDAARIAVGACPGRDSLGHSFGTTKVSLEQRLDADFCCCPRFCATRERAARRAAYTKAAAPTAAVLAMATHWPTCKRWRRSHDCIDREDRWTGVACAEHDGATMRERAGRDFGPNKPNAGKAKGFNRVRGCAPVPSVRGHEIPDEVVDHRHFGETKLTRKS